MKELLGDINVVVELELNRAIKDNGQFKTLHDGAGVIREELEEAEDELKFIKPNFECLWICTKNDNLEGAQETAKAIEKYAIRMAAEACQLAAVARKLQMFKGEQL